MSDGNPFRLDNTTNPFYTDNDYNKPIRDPRLYETMLVNGTQFGDHAAELWIGGRDNVNDTEKETGKYATGFGCYKFYKEGINSLKDKYLQWPYLRLAEMYLIKAEALVRQGKIGDARVVLQEFCSARYTDEVEIASDPETLLQEILDERIREFYQENDFRWLDMKRLGVRVERLVSGERFILQPDDFRYSFPIPLRELQLNKNMVQTPGWEKVILVQ